MRELSKAVPGTMPRNAVLVTHAAHPVPNFTAETTYSYFQESTSSTNNTLSNSSEFIDFDLFVATPNIIKSVLKKQPSNSSPEEDGITYH